MLAHECARLTSDRDWLKNTGGHLARAGAALDEAFAALANSAR